MTKRPLSSQAKADGRRLGQALAAERLSAGLSGGDLSAAAGVGVDTIRSVETGRVASPGFLVVAALCRAMGMSLDALVERVHASRAAS